MWCVYSSKLSKCIIGRCVKNCLRNNKMLKRARSENMSGKSKKTSKKGKDDSNLKEHMNRKIEFLDAPVKSESDQKTYRVICLENGLTAMLVSDVASLKNGKADSDSSDSSGSDESADESEVNGKEMSSVEDDDGRSLRSSKGAVGTNKLAAAALCVGVGSYSDPQQVQGLAHFLEHMVFMGSVKYPKENDFDSFIKKKGGSDNASTDCEDTTFEFEVREGHLLGALQRFSQFFVAPLMKKEAMNREREAVESEFQQAVTDDSERMEQLLASLAKPNHPVRTFTWGNMVTLKNNVLDDVLYKLVHEFRARHYSANRMTLAIQARLPLDTLQEMVVENFSDIPNNHLPAMKYTEYEKDKKSFDTEMFVRMYWVKPIKDICGVRLTWALPSMLHLYKFKPHQYVSYVIGHEGRGSLISFLRNRSWAIKIETGNGETGSEHNSMFALFTISLSLTQLGMSHLNKVLDAVFSYLALLRKTGPNKEIFDELKLLEDIDFRFADEREPIDNVEMLATNMQYYPPKDYLTGSELYFEYSEERIKTVLEALVPKKCNIMVLNSEPKDKIQYDQKEPWFGTEYLSKEIPANRIDFWRKIEVYPEFTLPEPNKYITTDFSLLKTNTSVPEYPMQVLKNDSCELWYRQDIKFQLPNANMFYYFITPLANLSPKHTSMLDLYVFILKQQLVEELYPAEVAQLKYAIYASTKGIVVKVEGFNQKLPLLMSTISKAIRDFPRTITEELFTVSLEEGKKYCHNNFIKPGVLTKDLRMCTLLQNHWGSLQKYPALHKITFTNIREFGKEFLKQLYVQNIVQGNITETTSLKTLYTILENLNAQRIPSYVMPEVRVVQLEKGEYICCTQSFNPDDQISVVTNYYQVGLSTLRDNCILELLMMLMQEPLFDTLRTKEQLGYEVYSEHRDTWNILGFTITVVCQADKHTTPHVDERIENFLSEFHKMTKHKMKNKEFNETKKSLIKLKECSDVILEDEVGRNWSEITSKEYLFDRLKLEVECISKLTLTDINKWLDEHLIGSDSYRKISFQVMGFKTGSKAAEKSPKIEDEKTTRKDYVLKLLYENGGQKPKSMFITDIVAFKKKLFLYPVQNMVIDK